MGEGVSFYSERPQRGEEAMNTAADRTIAEAEAKEGGG